jgi:glutamyl-tRNA synthetase
MSVVVRFAPSPTGFLHIGSARTALFNWLYAKHHGGTYHLRIEDTDRERSTPEAVKAIFESLKWLGINHDGDVVMQFARATRHAEVAHRLVSEGKAYYCYTSPEELAAMREDARAKGLPPRYIGYWRDRDPVEAPAHIKPVIRFKAPQEGETSIADHVQGDVRILNNQLDDMVLLRSDGTPTYMLSVVVDDHDMGITHVIRGDDHLTNAFRQKQLYLACGWDVPEFSHIPLIHGADGAKLSKRHGALGAEHYKAMGFLPEALCNYLLRLGWGHGDDEIISREQAIKWFDISGIGRSPSRFDIIKLNHVNGHYIRHTDDIRLLNDVKPFLNRLPTPIEEEWLLKGMTGLKERAKTLVELADGARIYMDLPDYDEKAHRFCTPDAQKRVRVLHADVSPDVFDSPASIETVIRSSAEKQGVKLGELAQPLRVALTHRTVSPSLFDIMHIIGHAETMKRLDHYMSR